MADRITHCKHCGKPLHQGSSLFSFKRPYPFCNKGCETKYKKRGRK